MELKGHSSGIWKERQRQSEEDEGGGGDGRRGEVRGKWRRGKDQVRPASMSENQEDDWHSCPSLCLMGAVVASWEAACRGLAGGGARKGSLQVSGGDVWGLHPHPTQESPQWPTLTRNRCRSEI